MRETYRCSSGLLHRVLYEQLELKLTQGVSILRAMGRSSKDMMR
jgi:hypothetical protein